MAMGEKQAGRITSDSSPLCAFRNCMKLKFFSFCFPQFGKAWTRIIMQSLQKRSAVAKIYISIYIGNQRAVS